jgi:hypothetical protein
VKGFWKPNKFTDRFGVCIFPKDANAAPDLLEQANAGVDVRVLRYRKNVDALREIERGYAAAERDGLVFEKVDGVGDAAYFTPAYPEPEGTVRGQGMITFDAVQGRFRVTIYNEQPGGSDAQLDADQEAIRVGDTAIATLVLSRLIAP